MNINKASPATAKEVLCKADSPQDGIVAGSMVPKSSAATCMDALLDAMSPECKALIIMPPESPIAKAVQPCFQERDAKKSGTVDSALSKRLTLVITLWITLRQTLTQRIYLHSSKTL